MSVAVSIFGVSKTYRTRTGAVQALGSVDLNIAPGAFVSLVGPSGCGKSTLLMILAGLLDCSSGQITINGRKVTGPETDIGIVFQGNVLVDWRNALDNVLLQVEMRGLSRQAYTGKAMELLASVGLKEFVRRYPYELSGGMQQRTAFCRALIHDPPLILMDEPLGALDAMTREQLRGDLEKLIMASPRTVVFVTHSIEEAVQLSDEVIVISPRPGTIVRRRKIDLPRPRDLKLRLGSEFLAIVAEIKELFMSYGVI